MTTHDTATGQAVRSRALVGIAGATGFAAIALIQAADPLVAGDAGFGARNVVSSAAVLMMLATVDGLARSRAAGRRWAAQVGLAVVALGWLLVAGAQLLTQLRGGEVTIVFVTATLVHVVGGVPVAVAVARAGGWTGWRRWIPLLCVVYLVVATPVFGMPGTPGHLAGAGWGLCWLLLAVALLGAGPRPRSQ